MKLPCWPLLVLIVAGCHRPASRVRGSSGAIEAVESGEWLILVNRGETSFSVPSRAYFFFSAPDSHKNVGRWASDWVTLDPGAGFAYPKDDFPMGVTLDGAKSVKWSNEPEAVLKRGPWRGQMALD